MPASRKRAQFVGGGHRAHRSKRGMTAAGEPHAKRERTLRDDRLDELRDKEIDDEFNQITNDEYDQ